MRLGPMEIGLILLIILVIFGAGKLPQVGGAIGRGIRELRQSMKGEDESEKEQDSKADLAKTTKT
jgi:sec-independent protein translocase protein TatA